MKKFIHRYVFLSLVSLGLGFGFSPVHGRVINQDTSSTISFTCQLSERSGYYRAIFVVVDEDSDPEDGTLPPPEEGESIYFCVYVNADSSFATWNALTDKNNGGILPGGWGNEDVRAQTWLGPRNPLVPSTNWANGEEKKPQSFGFALRSFSDTWMRYRFFFNQLDINDVFEMAVAEDEVIEGMEFQGDDEYYMYFVRVVEDVQTAAADPGKLCPALSGDACTSKEACLLAKNTCYSKADITIPCGDVPVASCEQATRCSRTANGQACVSKSIRNSQDLADNYAAGYTRPDVYDGPLPDCAFEGSCRNVNDIIQLGVNIGKFLFGIIGSVALLFFVYGGVTMILSMGNADRVKKGKDILVAAVIGIIISFSAYALINFVLDALDVSTDFRVVEDV